MFCPQCGQERISEATSFCSRCGYLLTGTSELLRTGGVLQQALVGKVSPRSQGIRRGIFIFLLMFVVAPIIGLMSMAVGLEPWPVGVMVALFGGGGILRVIYALLFESKTPVGLGERRELHTNLGASALPPQREMPASQYASPASAWRDSEPTSVTDNTTKLLEKETE